MDDGRLTGRRSLGWLRKAVAIAEKTFQDNLHFRSAFGMRVAGTVIQVVVLYALWSAIYANARQIRGFDFHAMVAYILVSQSLAALFIYFPIAQRFKSGDIAEDLVLPLDFQFNQMSQAAGQMGFSFLVVTVPLLATAWALGGGRFLPSVPQATLFAVSAVLGTVIMVNLRFLVGVLAFWTVNEWGMQMCVNVAASFFSGSLIPIAFFPDWFRAVSAFAPFQYGLYIPTAYFVGQLPTPQLFQALGLQLLWASTLFVAGRLVLRQAARRILIFGG